MRKTTEEHQPPANQTLDEPLHRPGPKGGAVSEEESSVLRGPSSAASRQESGLGAFSLHSSARGPRAFFEVAGVGLLMIKQG